MKFRLDYILFGCLSVFLIVSILTSDFQDPTFFNQLYPSIGVKNWSGLIGALIGGSLLEIFGPSTFLIPWLVVRIALHHPRKFSIFIAIYYALVIVFVLSILHELAITFGHIQKNDVEFIWQNGFAGKLGLKWIEESTDLNIGLFGLIAILTLSIVRIYHIISPIPLLLGIYSGTKNFIKIFFSRYNSTPSLKDQNKKNLPIFKGHSHIFEGDSKSKIQN